MPCVVCAGDVSRVSFLDLFGPVAIQLCNHFSGEYQLVQTNELIIRSTDVYVAESDQATEDGVIILRPEFTFEPGKLTI